MPTEAKIGVEWATRRSHDELGVGQHVATADEPLGLPRLAVVHGIEDEFDAAGDPELLENPKRYFLIVFWLRLSSRAISRLASPSATSATTCSSRGVSIGLPPEFTTRSEGTSEINSSRQFSCSVLIHICPPATRSRIDAFERLQTDVQLVMAGASSYCDDYSRELRSHAGERIRMLDWVSGETLDELLTNAMIFVLPSDMEGLSLALLDALGAGLCVLTSDVPENREVVDEAGFTFMRGDAGDLAERLKVLIANPAVREAAGKAAKRRIRERYLWDKIAADIEEVYFHVMGWKRLPVAPKKTAARVPADREVVTADRRAG